MAASFIQMQVHAVLLKYGSWWWRVVEGSGWCGVADSALPLCTHRLRSRSPRTHESEPSPSPSPRGTSADEASSRGRVPRGQPATERVHRCAGHVCRAVPPTFERCGGGCEAPIARCVASEVCQEHEHQGSTHVSVATIESWWWRVVEGSGWYGVADSAPPPVHSPPEVAQPTHARVRAVTIAITTRHVSQ